MEHACCGLTTQGTGITEGLFAVHVSKGHKPPKEAFVAVKHRGWWFWISDRDSESKATLALMLQLSRLDFGTGSPRLRSSPVLTLPAGR